MVYDLVLGNSISFDNVVGKHIYHSYMRSIEPFPTQCKSKKGLRDGIYQTKIFKTVPHGFNMSLDKFKAYKFIQIY